jgi:hypothetical protein
MSALLTILTRLSPFKRHLVAWCFVLLLCLALPRAAPAQVAYLSWRLSGHLLWHTEVPCESSEALAKKIRALSQGAPECDFRIRIRVVKSLDPKTVEEWSEECANIRCVEWVFNNGQPLVEQNAVRDARSRARSRLTRREQRLARSAQPAAAVGFVPPVVDTAPVHLMAHGGAHAAAHAGALPGLPMHFLPPPHHPVQLPPPILIPRPMYPSQLIHAAALAILAAQAGQLAGPTLLHVPTPDADEDGDDDTGVDVDFKEKRRRQ